jgi:hypothetical protein
VIGLSSGSRDSLGDALDGLESDILKRIVIVRLEEYQRIKKASNR